MSNTVVAAVSAGPPYFIVLPMLSTDSAVTIGNEPPCAMCFSRPDMPAVVLVEILSIRPTGTVLDSPAGGVEVALRCPEESLDIKRFD